METNSRAAISAQTRLGDNTSLHPRLFAHFIGIIILLGVLCIDGCQKPDPELELSTSSLEFEFSGETKSFTIESNSKWTVNKNDAWLTVSPLSGSNSGKVTVTAAENTTTTQREATITVSGGGIVLSVKVTQACASVTLSANTMSFSSVDEEKSFTIESNTNWTVSSNETSWLTVSPSSGSNNGTVTVKAAANSSTSQRTASITVSIGSAAQTIEVTQAGIPIYLNVSTTSISVLASGNTNSHYTFDIESNTDWTISKGDETWFSITPTSGANNKTISIYVDNNTSTSDLTATITVSGGNITHVIRLILPAPFMTVSETAISFSPSGGQKSFEVNSNVSWRVTSSETSWLTVSLSSGLAWRLVNVTATANTSISERTATITVSGGGITHTISVTQPGAELALIVSTTSLSFSTSAEEKTFSIESNQSWTVSSNASWLTVSPSSGVNNGTVTARVTANTTSTVRTATITIMGGEVTQTITVTQARAPFLTVSTNGMTFTTTAQQRTFTIESNQSWTVDRGSATWITVSPVSGSNNEIITISVEANVSTSTRTAVVTVTGGGIVRTINVTQLAATYLEVSRASMSFSSLAQSNTFYIESNTSWTVNRGSTTWITVSPAAGANNGTITVTVTPNTSTTQRSGTITVSGGGRTETVTVSQDGAFSGLGAIAFYTRRDFGCGYINVTLSGKGTKTITGYYFIGTPGCGAEYTATFTDLPMGTYSYSASCSGRSWSGTVTLTTSCQSVQLE